MSKWVICVKKRVLPILLWVFLSAAILLPARAEELLLLEEEKEAEIKELNAQLTAMDAHKEKSAFLDKYVVFVVNDDSRVYHTYDCPQFTKKDFWAYSRKLAESNGFAPCPTCGGTP